MINKKKLIVANWKMNIDIIPEAKKLVSEVKRKTSKIKKTDIIFCPPSIYFQALASLMKGRYFLGAQDISSQERGSYTGEVSAFQLKQFEAKYSIVGHSERRRMGETDLLIADKAMVAISSGLSPIICVGENKRDEEGEYLGFIKKQLAQSLSKITKATISRVVIAYEPVWTIGAKEPMSPHSIHEMVLYIKKCLNTMFGDYSSTVKIIYGGSVFPQYTEEIIKDGFVDGLLVGRDSLDGDLFSQIIRITDGVK